MVHVFHCTGRDLKLSYEKKLVTKAVTQIVSVLRPELKAILTHAMGKDAAQKYWANVWMSQSSSRVVTLI